MDELTPTVSLLSSPCTCSLFLLAPLHQAVHPACSLDPDRDNANQPGFAGVSAVLCSLSRVLTSLLWIFPTWELLLVRYRPWTWCSWPKWPSKLRVPVVGCCIAVVTTRPSYTGCDVNRLLRCLAFISGTINQTVLGWAWTGNFNVYKSDYLHS